MLEIYNKMLFLTNNKLEMDNKKGGKKNER